ncbi:MAG TPA: hypothetical protein VIV11_36680 [Kofleriaceae bacterium]
MIRLAACVLVASQLSCTFSVDGHTHDEPETVLDMSTALLVKSRDRLAVCLQIDPLLAEHTQVVAARLHADLVALADAHPDWQASGLDHGEISVEVGCPGGAIVDGPISAKGAGGVVLGPGLLEEPSPFRTHVHVIADSRATAVLGDEPYARALAELAQVDEHRVAEVSTALVVPASALGSEAFRMQALADSLGLQPR